MSLGVPATGRAKLKVAPPPGLFEASSLPLCAFAMERQMESPMPRPSGLVEKKGS